jgi:GWxTD domain-containing protein
MRIRTLVVSTLALSLIASGQRENKLRRELESPYQRWLNEDVAYILTDEERTAWTLLATDEEREQFIEQFWLRRDPTPETAENEYKEEHYRRIAYSNERYASGIPGWKSDRGHIYIVFGPPDEIESHPSGGAYERTPQEGGGTTTTYPFEKWRYRWIEGIGTDIVIEFVDKSGAGDYRFTMDPSEKTAVPGVRNNAATDQFERLRQFAAMQKPPAVKFKDLEALVDTAIRFNILPVRGRADYFPLTESSVRTNITVQLENKDLQFHLKDGMHIAVVNLYGRITTLTRRVTNVFEDTVTVDSPADLLGETSKRSSVYQKSMTLPPGEYRLNLVLRDVTSGAMNSYELALHVPRFENGKLASSSLVLADLIEKTPTLGTGGRAFLIGGSKVRPRLSGAFRRDEKMGIYLQVHNFTGGSIGYEVVKTGSDEKVIEFSELFANHPAGQVTIEKLLPLADLPPGLYTLRMNITDVVVNQTLTPSAHFTVI